MEYQGPGCHFLEYREGSRKWGKLMVVVVDAAIKGYNEPKVFSSADRVTCFNYIQWSDISAQPIHIINVFNHQTCSVF